MDYVYLDMHYVMDGQTARTEVMNGIGTAVRNDHLISNIYCNVDSSSAEKMKMQEKLQQLLGES